MTPVTIVQPAARPLLVVLLLAACVASPAAARSDELLLINARIVDPAAQEIRDASLLIRDGVIAATLDAAPDDFAGEVVDLQGKWVIPGLTDMHVHSFGNQNPSRDQPNDAPRPAGTAVRVLTVGVTGFVDLFGGEEELYATRARQRAGEIGGADIFASLSCLTSTRGHCTEYGVATRTMDTPEEARAVVADLAQRDPDVVKIVYEPGATWASIDKETFAAAVAEASAHGLKTIVHINSWQAVGDAIDVGASAVTHVPDDPIPDGMAARMADSGIVFIPTLAVETDLVDFVYDADVLDNPMARALTTPAVIETYRSTELRAQIDPNRAAGEARNAITLRTVKAAADAGVTILLGTDAGNWGTLQGYSVHRELMIMVEAGLTPWQALASSTTEAGDFLGRSFGVNPGDEANLVVLNASPIEDIANTQAIAMVIHHGEIIDREALLASELAGLAAYSTGASPSTSSE